MHKHILRSVLFALALTSVAACGNKSGSGGGGSKIDSTSYKAVGDSIHSGDAWAATTASVDKLFGAAKIKTENEWTWAADNGEDCWEVKLSKDGDKVGGWEGGSVNKMVESEYAKCAAEAKLPAATP